MTPAGFVALDGSGLIKAIGRTTAKVLNVDPRHALGLPFFVFVAAGDGRLFFDHLRRCARGDGFIFTDLRLRPRYEDRGRAFQLCSAPGQLLSGLCYPTLLSEQAPQPEVGREAPSVHDTPAATSGRETSFHHMAVVAHEIRNALTPLSMGLPILKNAEAPREKTQIVHEMFERQVDLMTRLVNDLLDLTRIDQGTIRLDRQRIDLNDVLRAVADVHRLQFEERGIELRIARSAEPLYVMADRVRIAQVLANLLQNAAKFTDRHGVVSAHVAEDCGEALLTVRDTGIGLMPEAIERLFTPFAQFTHDRARNHSGLGLGLALVKTLVELHGGTVRAASAGIGRGAEFSIRLPLFMKTGVRSAVATKPSPAEDHAPRLSVA